MKTQAAIMPGIYKRVRYSRKEGSKMIQDIAPHKLNNQYGQKKALDAGSRFLYYDGRKVLVRKGIGGNENQIAYPTYEELKKCMPKDVAEDTEYTYLFAVDDKSYYLGKKENVGILSEQMGYEWIDHQEFRCVSPKYEAFAGITGWQLARWYQDHKFCGRCGNVMKPDHVERMMQCPKCGLMEFPKICPAVIIGVIDGDRILMSKYAGREYKKYALLAGFTEIGETLEETVSREVMEEVGLKVKNITYYKNQPWAFSDTLLMGFFCELDGSDLVKLDENELALAEWFGRNQIPVEPDDISLTNEMMMVFRDGYTI